MHPHIISDLVAHFGSQGKTAKAVGCSQATVFKWLHGQMNISALNALKIENITSGKFRAVDLCPRLAEIEAVEPKNKTP